VHIVPNALEFPTLLQHTKLRDTTQLLMTANFFPEKDHSTVLRALAVYRQQPDAQPVHLHLIGAAPGRSPQFSETKALAFDLGLCGSVTFHGTVKDMHPHLSGADIGILSTRSEGMSNAILEYMAYGLPVIATDITANREALGPANAEWLFPIGDAAGLCQLIAMLAAHPDRDSIGQANKAYVESRHSVRAFEQQLMKILGNSKK
jgi:glycosyltransferase involved in cell wall biosynthesis